MESFVKKLIINIKRKKSHVVVGLDPVYDFFPKSIIRNHNSSIEGIGLAIFEFNKFIIDAVYDLIPAVKPQIAFYERYGIDGIKAFIKTVSYAKEKGLIVIEDAKRNDIGSTAKAYSDGHIGRVKINKNINVPIFDVDAITVNPYLGSDGIIPFVDDCGKYSKGIFILVKTSNPSSCEFQDLFVKDKNSCMKLYEVIAQFVNKLGEDLIDDSNYSSVGAVVGATFPNEATILRKLMPHSYWLVPGYGAQGGSVDDIIRCFNNDGLGAIVSSSRGINYAYINSEKYNDKHFDDAARNAVKEMNNSINNALKNKGILNW